MKEPPILARDLDTGTQAFLLTCALGVARADRDVVPAERAWLLVQFGEEAMARAEAEEVPLVPGAFLDTCARLGGRLTDHQQERIYPHLRLWLLSLAHADSLFALTERVVVKQLLHRLGIPLRPVIQMGGPCSKVSSPRRLWWLAEASPSLLPYAMVVFAVAFGAVLLVRAPDKSERTVKYLYLEPPLDEVQRAVRAALSRTKYEDVLVLSDFPVTVPAELLRAAVDRAGFPTNFTAAELPWTMPNQELTYVCLATASAAKKRVCALLRLHPVPDTPAWFGSIDFGSGPHSAIAVVRTTRIPLPADSAAGDR